MSAHRILVVEDEFLVALDMETILADAGFEVLGPVGCVEEAVKVLAEDRPEAALLDNNLNGQSVGPVAAELHGLHVPFAFVTGNDRQSLPVAFAGAPLLRKPFTAPALIAMARLLIRAAEPIGQKMQIPG